MWFSLSVLAMIMLAVRRTAEKKLTSSISSLALAWLQQGVALPFIVATLFFAPFYLPSELPSEFWTLMFFYVILGAVDLYFYFKALTMSDISYIAPLMTLTAVSSIIGAYIILDQKPTTMGLIGAALIVIGVYITNRAKLAQKGHVKANRLSLLMVLGIIVIRGYYANTEVLMLRESNPTTFNFYSSVLTVPFVFLISFLIVRSNKGKYPEYWKRLGKGVKTHILPLLFVGVTYTINLLATYQAKLLSPDAGYVTAIKSAAVLPIVLIGAFVLHEKVSKWQWIGLGVITSGLVVLTFH